MLIGRGVIAVLALFGCASCTPIRHDHHSATAPVIAAPVDRRLLQRLALTVPDEAPTMAAPLRPPADGAPPFVAAAASLDDEQRATDCLSAAVYYEARSEPIDGQRAVAQVVLNRVRDRAFPASVCRVVYQRSVKGCQFSFVCDGSTGHPLEPRAWQVAQAIARAALAGNVYAPVGSATHYHTTAILPWWASSLARVGVVGSHIFYRWADHLAGALSFRQAYSGREVASTGVTMAASTALGAPLDSGTSEEAGVTVHRGLAAPHVAPAVAFGVRVHRGDEAMAPAPGASPEDTAAKPG